MTTVELLKGENTRRYDNKGERWVGEFFDRGERVIMVDGVRWGRTWVKSHGSGGTTTTFQQQGGDVLVEDTEKTRHVRSREIAVRSMNKRHERISAIGRDGVANNGNWRPTEELALEKAQELVKAGKLRHPDIVRREQEKAHARWLERQAKAERDAAEAFRNKAMEALQINDPTSAIIDRVVDAMRWAQSQ